MRYITPEHCIRSRLDGRPQPLWPAALLVFRDYESSQTVLRAFDNIRPVQYRLLYNLTSPDFEPYVFEADVAGETVAIVTRCVWGGPQAAILVEELAHLGVRTIVGYGVTGSLDPELRQGSFVVADSAITCDGTSRAYGADSRQCADGGLVDLAITAAAKRGREMKTVTAVTVDALYRETDELVDAFRAQGAQVINLETSPFYAASAACGVQSVWFGYVTDCLGGGKWADWFADLGSRKQEAARLCRELMERILAE